MEMEDGGLGEQQSSGESEDGESWSLLQYDTCNTVDIRGYIICSIVPIRVSWCLEVAPQLLVITLRGHS